MIDIVNAINNCKILEFEYEGHLRKVIPFAYGSHVTTHNKVLRALQIAGTSESGKFDFPKLFNVEGITDIKVLDEAFEVPDRYTKGDKAISPVEAEL